MTIIIDKRIQSHIPPLRADERKQLEELILREGCKSPLILWGDTLVDGHNRYAICTQHGLPYETEQKEFDSFEDAIAWAEENQLGRRNLTADQFAYFIGRRYERLKRQGSRTDLTSGKNCQKSQAQTASRIAEEHGISEKTVRNSAEFARNVDSIAASIGEDARSAILSGEDSLTRSDVAEIAASVPSANEVGLVFKSPREAFAWATAERAKQREIRHAKRIAKMVEINAGNAELASARTYSVLYADPPWNFHLWSPDGDGRAADQHYPTMPLADICNMPVSDIVASDAVLFMWTTAPHLKESFSVLEAWGFEYVTNVAWVKDKIGLGYWVRNQHELLLIARRGDIPAPLPENRAPSVIEAPRREHSRKPDEAYELIERMYPELPKIELFARNARPGWDAWGNQAPTSDAA
jgi:N6-adenosine-specific RNA methylase IME4